LFRFRLMPPTQRRKLRAELSNPLFQLVCMDTVEGGDGTSPVIAEVVELYAGLMSSRYLNQRVNIPRPVYDQRKVFELRDDEFHNQLRVSRSTFDFVLSLIKDHRLFHNNSLCKQRDVDIQLAVTLEWYGGNGNGNQVGRIARGFGIGAGTVSTYVRRVDCHTFEKERYERIVVVCS
jgi:hypothetical protein